MKGKVNLDNDLNKTEASQADAQEQKIKDTN